MRSCALVGKPLDRGEVAAINEEIGFKVTNEMRSRLEVARFKRERPSDYFAYVAGEVVHGAKITTWTGEELGTVTGWPNRWQSNMGDWRVSIRVRAITGDTYSGTAFVSAGDYCRLRKVKA